MATYTNEEIVEIIDNEGLGYAIMDYINPESIDDHDVREAFLEAYASLEHLISLLPELAE